MNDLTVLILKMLAQWQIRFVETSLEDDLLNTFTRKPEQISDVWLSGLSRIERFAKASGLDSVSRAAWNGGIFLRSAEFQ